MNTNARKGTPPFVQAMPAVLFSLPHLLWIVVLFVLSHGKINLFNEDYIRQFPVVAGFVILLFLGAPFLLNFNFARKKTAARFRWALVSDGLLFLGLLLSAGKQAVSPVYFGYVQQFDPQMILRLCAFALLSGFIIYKRYKWFQASQ